MSARALLVVGAALFVLVAGCAPSSSSMLEVKIQGAGHVWSDSPDRIDCAADASGTTTGTCAQTFYGTHLVRLHADAPTGSSLAGWQLSVSADCTTCNSGDPDMGTMTEEGPSANVVVDVNDGYDGTETVIASFGGMQ